MESIQARVQEAVHKMLNQLDKEHLRKMQNPCLQAIHGFIASTYGLAVEWVKMTNKYKKPRYSELTNTRTGTQVTKCYKDIEKTIFDGHWQTYRYYWKDVDKQPLHLQFLIKADMYYASAKCVENPHYNMEDAQRCVEQCSVPINQAQQIIGNEIQSFQDRLQRCAMDCQDKARDRLGPGASEENVAKARGQMEKCVLKCADDHIALVPNMTKRMKDAFKKK